jgi:cell pole-organizing protein PopZ
MSSASLRVNEPSMEDILASIRRIIADDQEAMDGDEVSEPVAAPMMSSPLKTVLDLTERHVQPLRTGSALKAETRATVVDLTADDGGQPLGEGLLSALLGKEPVAAPIPEAPAARVQAEAASPGSLLSAQASASVVGSLDKLSSTLMPSRSQALEDLMKEMLRPMLKSWLDQNLPALVERLVQAEIERIACGRR